MSKCYSNDEEREKIILENKALVYHVFKTMNMTFRIDDMFDIGLIGLIRGVDTYDKDKGFELSTYLAKCIRHELSKQLVYENAEKRQAELISLNQPLYKDGEKITVEDSIGYELNLDRDLIEEEILNIINHRLYFLPERNEKIFKHLHGLDGYKKMTRKEVAEKFKISPTRVGEINEKVMRMLKFELRKY